MNEITADDIADAVTAFVGTTTPLDQNTADMLKQLTLKILVPKSKETD